MIEEGKRRDIAAAAVGSTGTRFRRLYVNNETFARHYDKALQMGALAIEDQIRQEVHNRAMARGDPQSGRLLSKLADALLPEFVKLREHTTRHEGKVVHGHVDLTKLTDERLEQLYEILEDASSDEPNVIQLPRAV